MKPRYFKSHSRKTGSQDSESDSARNPVPTYLILNKPYQVLTRFTDPNGRSTLADYVSVPEVYPAGRLDFDSEGLLVLTDDGPLAHRLTDPRFDHPKTYLAQVERIPEESSLDKIRKGIILGDGPCKPAD
ncbi:MAG: Ribosomal large subunit pseudouridine synthase, partial [Planctomycetota bacterium]